MDKKFMHDDQKIEVHRLIGEMPAIFAPGGFRVLNASVGVRAPADGFFDTPVRRFEFFSLSHMYDGGGRLWLADGTECAVEPGDAILIAPNALNRYGGAEGMPYVEDSIRFAGPAADAWAARGLLNSGIYRLGTKRRIPELAALLSDPAERVQLLAAARLQELLWSMVPARSADAGDAAWEKLLTVLKEHAGEWWTVTEMAGFLGVRPPVLRRIFLVRTGLLPKNYLERLKLHQAAGWLLEGADSIRDTAGRFGYRDAYHFSRRFKLLFGVSPERYRREYRHLR